MLQVSSAGGAILTFGAVIFCVTAAEADAEHPLPGSVTVTEYVPAVLAAFVAVVTPPPQLYVAPGVVALVVNVTLSTLQVRLAGGAMLTLGAMIFCVTAVDAVAVHPFAGSVTVTEYVPAVFTVFVEVVTPPPQL